MFAVTSLLWDKADLEMHYYTLLFIYTKRPAEPWFLIRNNTMEPDRSPNLLIIGSSLSELAMKGVCFQTQINWDLSNLFCLKHIFFHHIPRFFSEYCFYTSVIDTSLTIRIYSSLPSWKVRKRGQANTLVLFLGFITLHHKRRAIM